MNCVILGFGRCEEQERHKIKKALRDGAVDEASATQVLDRWNRAADKYDKMPTASAPERYTTVHYYDGHLHFLHINRRHPFSPDGWAAWKVEEPFVFSGCDGGGSAPRTGAGLSRATGWTCCFRHTRPRSSGVCGG